MVSTKLLLSAVAAAAAAIVWAQDHVAATVGSAAADWFVVVSGGCVALLAVLLELDRRLALFSDLRYMLRLKNFKAAVERWAARDATTADMWAVAASKWGDRQALVCGDASLTFAQLDALSNRVAHWALAPAGAGGAALQPGDAVGLAMANRLEYVATWLGLTKAGLQPALLNIKVKGASLAHCIKSCGAVAVIFGVECAEGVASLAGTDFAAPMYAIAEGILTGASGDGTSQSISASVVPGLPDGAVDVTDAIAAASSNDVALSHRAGIGFNDTFGYLFTSGTTGLPKAVVVRHSKMATWGSVFSHAFKLSKDDRVYCCLPMYHTSGVGPGVGSMMHGGSTLVISRTFSAHHFWADVDRHGITVIQYIGEICRYLLQADDLARRKAPAPPNNVRIALGNGLAPDIWREFQERYRVEIGEMYGSTEGNLGLINHCTDPRSGAVGAIGRMGWILRKITGARIVRFDYDSELPVRDARGRCIEAEFGEAGELVTPIRQSDPRSHFAGYTDRTATQAKIIRDVFVAGDAYVRTGDLMRLEPGGFYRFVDRIGDTFRWKGENVSTTEVATITAQCDYYVQAVTAYGVKVPGYDGRACMVAVVPPKEFHVDDIDDVLASCVTDWASSLLPSYAAPRFIRFVTELETTGTYKHAKARLREEGADPARVKDPLFWWESASGGTFPLTADEWARITRPGSEVRL